MRSGGPFDSRWGLGCIAVDRYLSVQVQVPGTVGSTYGGGITGAGTGMGSRFVSSGAGAAKESEPLRERRSFAPSPPSSSMRGLPVSESEKTAVMGDMLGRDSEGDEHLTVDDESKTGNAKGELIDSSSGLANLSLESHHHL